MIKELQKISKNEWQTSRTFLPPAYVVRREGNSFTLFVSPHLGGRRGGVGQRGEGEGGSAGGRGGSAMGGRGGSARGRGGSGPARGGGVG